MKAFLVVLGTAIITVAAAFIGIKLVDGIFGTDHE